MKPNNNSLEGASILVGLVVAIGGSCIQTIAQESDAESELALEAIQSTTPIPASLLPAGATFHSAQHPLDWPPFPGNVHDLPAWPLGDGFFLLDDADFDYDALAELMAAAGFPFVGPLTSSRSYTSTDLWLEINGMTNGGTGWTADLTIHTPEGDTNSSSYDLLYSAILESPTDCQFLMRCPTNIIAQTNVFARYLCEEQGFFILRDVTTNCDLIVTTNVTPQQMAELLMPPWAKVTNATYTGAVAARGVFSNGNCCGLPIESGVIFSSGYITNALGTNDDAGSEALGDAGGEPDTDLDLLVGGQGSDDAAVLGFDVVSTNSCTLRFRYVCASEEDPEYSGADYNDPMGIFVSTNRAGGKWVVDTTNNIALVPGATNIPVTVNTVRGGYTNDVGGDYVSPTNALYYVDNHDPLKSAVPPHSVGEPVFNIQYDGMTVLLEAQTDIAANVTNHLKIAIADFSDAFYDSAVLLEAWAAAQCP